MLDFRERLTSEGVIIADGAAGTILQQAGLQFGSAPERWNIENPAKIHELHRAYLDAGSEIILTNTFGGTRIRLQMDGLGEKVHAANAAGARIAREEAGENAWVLGDMGPTGQILEPLGNLNRDAAVAAFTEQASALAENGVDGILIETMSDLEEAKAAVAGARRATSLPILVTMSFDTHGYTMMGVSPEEAARELSELGIDGIGANCGRTLSETLEAIRKMRDEVPEALLMAKPNAGLPRLEHENMVYDVSPEVMADYALKFAALEVKIFGGCCGSTPEHIAAIAKVLRTNES
jgi:5-methyltetrahydrofolate--homocysteine methyltransferase